MKVQFRDEHVTTIFIPLSFPCSSVSHKNITLSQETEHFILMVSPFQFLKNYSVMPSHPHTFRFFSIRATWYVTRAANSH
jgi:hypothetical protein